MTTAVAASVCCCDEEIEPPPPFGGTCIDFPDFIELYGPRTRTGHLKLEVFDSGSWATIFDVAWLMKRLDIAYDTVDPPYPIDPGGFWRGGTGGALPFSGTAGQCWNGEDIAALQGAGYLQNGPGYFEPLVEKIQFLRLECGAGNPAFAATLRLASSLVAKCALAYFTDGYYADPEDPFSYVPPVTHTDDCCNKGCCDDPDPPFGDCFIIDLSEAGAAIGPEYTIEEFLTGLWTLPDRTSTFSVTFESCPIRQFRVTTSVT